MQINHIVSQWYYMRLWAVRKLKNTGVPSEDILRFYKNKSDQLQNVHVKSFTPCSQLITQMILKEETEEPEDLGKEDTAKKSPQETAVSQDVEEKNTDRDEKQKQAEILEAGLVGDKEGKEEKEELTEEVEEIKAGRII